MAEKARPTSLRKAGNRLGSATVQVVPYRPVVLSLRSKYTWITPVRVLVRVRLANTVYGMDPIFWIFSSGTPGTGTVPDCLTAHTELRCTVYGTSADCRF